MVGASGLRLAGPIAYDGVMHDKAWIGEGGAEATAGDLRRALAVYLLLRLIRRLPGASSEAR